MYCSVYFVAVVLASSPLITCGQPFSPGNGSSENTDADYQRIFLYRFFRYFGSVSSQLSGECLHVMNRFWDGRDREEWASKSKFFSFEYSDSNFELIYSLTVLDSNAVLESGLASGNIQFLGQFDECLSLQIPNSVSNAQYCSVRFPLSLLPFIGSGGGSSKNSSNSSAVFPPIVVQISPPLAGLCIPAVCKSDTDLRVILAKCKWRMCDYFLGVCFLMIFVSWFFLFLDSELTNSSVEVVHCTTPEEGRLVNRFQPVHVVIL